MSWKDFVAKNVAIKDMTAIHLLDSDYMADLVKRYSETLTGTKTDKKCDCGASMILWKVCPKGCK